MRVLVTGIGGFVGPHLARALGAAGHVVDGVELPGVELPSLPAVAMHAADLLDGAALEDVVAAARPDAVVHLAAISFVPAAEANPRAAYRVNVEGTVGVLAALEAAAPGARVLVVGSSDAYGAVKEDDLPIREDLPLSPRSVYGATKAAVEVAAAQWSRSRALEVVVARPFNHTGPGQSSDFVVPAFARQVARIEAGLDEPVVRVGDLSPERDLSDVRDIVRGYVALLERGAAGATYNLCAGVGVRIGALLDELRAAATVPVRVETDPARLRPVEVPRVVGSHERATHETGWRPEIPMTTTLADVLDDWRSRIG